MTPPPRRRQLPLRLAKDAIWQLLAISRQEDIEQGGLCDARSGCVNFWCSPEDKPACWDAKIRAGALAYPRSYVGALDWEWSEDETATLFVAVSPYDLLDERAAQELPAEDWNELFRWTQEKAGELVAQAQASRAADRGNALSVLRLRSSHRRVAERAAGAYCGGASAGNRPPRRSGQPNRIGDRPRRLSAPACLGAEAAFQAVRPAALILAFRLFLQNRRETRGI